MSSGSRKRAGASAAFLTDLVHSVHRLGWADVPEAARRRAKEVVLDTVGVILLGNRAPYIRDLFSNALSRTEPGGSTVFGWSRRLEPSLAGWINASGGTVCELDEGHRFGRGHPGIGVVPTVFALAEALGLSGEEALEQIVLGYEFSARAAQAIGPLKPSLHPHGPWGVLGAAFTAARTLGLTEREVETSVRAAASLSVATGRSAVGEGATVRNLYAGFGVQIGMLCAETARAGVSAPEEALEAYARIVAQGPFVPDRSLLSSGQPFEITRNYFKRHAACAHLHAALDALEQAMVEHAISREDMESLHVSTYSEAAAMDGRSDLTPVSARFSVPYALSARLVTGGTGPSAFEPEAIERVVRSGWLSRITVTGLGDATAQGPRPAKVDILLNDGNRVSAAVPLPLGHFDRPFAAGALESKFHRLTSGFLTEDQRDSIVTCTLKLEELASVSAYVDLLHYADL